MYRHVSATHVTIATLRAAVASHLFAEVQIRMWTGPIWNGQASCNAAPMLSSAPSFPLA